MLPITIPSAELWDESKEEFVTLKEQKLELEHSLVSLSKWESKWCKPFFDKKDKTLEETIDYIKCMTLSKGVSDDVYTGLSPANIKEINDYIAAPMTATRINDKTRGNKNGELLTSEVIYACMIDLNIPFECQKWHLNRLLTLIKVCSIRQSPPKKMSQKEILKSNAELNAARRKAMGTKG